MASSSKMQSLSDTSSSDDDSSPMQSFAPPTKKRNVQQYVEDGSQPLQIERTRETHNRSTVIVSPSFKDNQCSISTTSSMVNTSTDSQGSGTSEDEKEILSAHRTFIKPKPMAAPIFDQKASAMMAKMGWAKGTGLGKKSQGMVQPIEVSKQRGRRGLGMQIKGLEAEEVEWDSSQEVIEVEEVATWFPSHDTLPPSLSELKSWIVVGNKKSTVEDETMFCDEDVLQQVLQCKTIFDELEDEELRKSRSRSNPFETIRGGVFLNRAAMKMANLDAVFDFMFTDPKTEEENPFVPSNELLYFADVCAGPGGFSEYVLWRKKWEAKGFGFTLKRSNDFKLEDFHAAPCECFEPHYGVNGVDGDGDVYNSDNIEEFRRFVLAQTEGKGVYFMMADGGFSVEGQENIQEVLSKRLYLCQFLVALAIVRTGGHFVCKLFDVFTPFSVGLIYLMYRAFKRVSIHKPNTSRPANSERYITCKWKRQGVQDIEAYFFEINDRLKQLSGDACSMDVLEIVPTQMLTTDRGFYNYMVESNNVLGMKQVVNLAKIAAFCKDVTLREDRQNELKKQSLDFWRIPDKARTAPPRTSPMDRAREILLTNNIGVLDFKPALLAEMPLLQENVKSVYDWKCVILGLEEDNPLQTFFLGLGRNNVFRWDPTKSRWIKVVENVELARDTLVYGELIQELRGEGRSQKRSCALHIIDAIFLGGVDVSQLHLNERYDKTRQFAKALFKPSRTDLVIVRVKEQFRLEELDQVFYRLIPRIIKNSGCQERLVFSVDGDDQRTYLPSGLLLLKATKSPWLLALSKNSGKKYWFHVMMRNSSYECPKDSISDFFESYKHRMAWWWKKTAQQTHPDLTFKSEFTHFSSLIQGLSGK